MRHYNKHNSSQLLIEFLLCLRQVSNWIFSIFCLQNMFLPYNRFRNRLFIAHRTLPQTNYLHTFHIFHQNCTSYNHNIDMTSLFAKYRRKQENRNFVDKILFKTFVSFEFRFKLSWFQVFYSKFELFLFF